jgi:hypothetical protein
MQRHSFSASLNSTFVVDSEYQFVKELGQDAYGHVQVVAARHCRSGKGRAIKKITNIDTKVRMVSNIQAFITQLIISLQCILARRCLREIRYV